ncbi:MAG: hypothetical protein LBT69_01775 [Lactobacillales bacterium]|jgi:hypothetical protein|nr:hypothetical protein [Lactobacillales bacterium]
MANTHNLFQQFNSDLQITDMKRKKMITSRDSLRDKIRNDFRKNHDGYNPAFYIQGSYKMGTTIRTKDDTCDLDDGVYFDSNPDNVTCTTLQTWVNSAVDGTTDDIQHNEKCITVNYKGDYNIDLPVYLFDKNNGEHPYLAVKNADWREDDPKEMVETFNNTKDSKGQLLKLVRYLKAWCDYKREKMPSGLAVTILAMNDFQTNDRDDVALKYTLVEIEKTLKKKFECIVPATPNDDIFADYDETRKNNFLNNLSDFITDAKKAVDEEKNQLKAGKLWQKHLGDRFPDGEDKDEENVNAKSVAAVAGTSKPYYAG